VPTKLDFGYLLFLFVLVTLVEGLVFFPKFKAAVAAGVPDARAKAYRRTTIGQWVFSAVVVVAWIVTRRSWTALGLVPQSDWHFRAALGVLAGIVAFGLHQSRSIARLADKPDDVALYRERLSELRYLLPHTREEYRRFVLLSVTAGVCEELLVRGYLMWVLRSYMGVTAAIAVSAVAFGLGHAYQGVKGIVKTTVVGVVMNLIVLLSGWLVPAMIVHAIIDANAGQVGFIVFRESGAGRREMASASTSG
jgi:membrane protease YdiL (CAAX protease family)